MLKAIEQKHQVKRILDLKLIEKPIVYHHSTIIQITGAEVMKKFAHHSKSELLPAQHDSKPTKRKPVFVIISRQYALLRLSLPMVQIKIYSEVKSGHGQKTAIK